MSGEKIFEKDLMEGRDISDVIINKHSKNLFINIATGKEGLLSDVIRNDKKYVICDMSKLLFLAEYNRAEDQLYVAFYSVERDAVDEEKFNLELVKQQIISRTGSQNWEKEPHKSHVIFDEDRKANAYDLCGCYIGHGNNGVNINLSSGDEIRRFTDGVLYTCDSKYFTFRVGCHTTEIAAIIDEDSQNKVAPFEKRGIREIDMEGIDVPPLAIPAYYKECMQRFLHLTVRMWRYIFIEGKQEFGYLQNINGEYVLRVLVPYISEGFCFHANNVPTLTIGYDEVRRIHITENVLEHMGYLNIPLLCYDRDGIFDGIFKNAEKYLAEAESFTIKEMANSYFEAINKCSIKLACASAFLPIFNKTVDFFTEVGVKETERDRYKCQPADNITYFKAIVYESNYNLFNTMELLFGGSIFYNEAELYKSISVNKEMLYLLGIRNDFFSLIRFMRNIFAGNEEYMMNMTKPEVEDLLDYLKFIMESDFWDDFAGIPVVLLKKLIKFFGPEQTPDYFRFVCSSCYDHTLGFFKAYNDYLDKLIMVNPPKDELEYRLDYEGLQKAKEKINPSYTIVSNKEVSSVYEAAFKAQYDDWKKYEYNDGEFFVRMPNSAVEIATEGFVLGNKAETHLKNIAKGTTALFFIRKSESPEKPFFTMEIAGDTIKQCKGYGNGLMKDQEGLTEFVEKYAKEKGLKVNLNLLNIDFSLLETI